MAKRTRYSLFDYCLDMVDYRERCLENYYLEMGIWHVVYHPSSHVPTYGYDNVLNNRKAITLGLMSPWPWKGISCVQMLKDLWSELDISESPRECCICGNLNSTYHPLKPEDG
jgi:hypothetical protein